MHSSSNVHLYGGGNKEFDVDVVMWLPLLGFVVISYRGFVELCICFLSSVYVCNLCAQQPFGLCWSKF